MILVVTMVGFYMGAQGVPDWGWLLHVLLGVAFAAGRLPGSECLYRARG